MASQGTAQDEDAAGGGRSTRVVVRVRGGPTQPQALRCLQCDGQSITLRSSGSDGSALSFTFDKVLGEAAQQQDVYGEVGDAVDSVCRGQSATILSYGQTGSGKTHSLFGVPSDRALRGVVPRVLQRLCDHLATSADLQASLSVVEIYCERIGDLLGGGDAAVPGAGCITVQQGAGRGGASTLLGATSITFRTYEEAMACIETGLAQRKVAATGCNAASSRSHCCVLITLTAAPGASRPTPACRLSLVDLAGSERHDKTGAEGLTQEEGRMINRSLSALGNVVNALTEGGPARHIPYRDSKLTRLLQDSLGGSARLVLLVCCSPLLGDAAETLSSLRFGARAKGIVAAVPAVRASPAEGLARELEGVLQDNARLKQSLAAAAAEAGAEAQRQRGDAQRLRAALASSRALTSLALALMALKFACGVYAALQGQDLLT